MLLSAIWHWVWRFTVIQNTLEGIRFHFRLSGMGYYINMSFIPPERLGFRGNMLILLLLSSTLNNWIEKRASTVFFYRVFAKIFTICFTLHPSSTCSHTTQKVTKEAFLQALSFSINRSIKNTAHVQYGQPPVGLLAVKFVIHHLPPGGPDTFIVAY